MDRSGIQTRESIQMSVTLPCEAASIQPAVNRVLEFLHARGMNDDDGFACATALTEAVNNAAQYALPERRGEPIEIEADLQSGGVLLRVRDHTPGFKWPAHPKMPDPLSERGRGLFIIESLMDEARYYRGPDSNILVLRKNFSGANGNGVRAAQVSESGLTTAPVPKGGGVGRSSENNKRTSGGTDDARALRRELKWARNIQRNLFPRKWPSIRGIGVTGVSQSCRAVSGDFFDARALKDGTLLVMIADVMGKGVPAAMFAPLFHSHMTAMIHSVDRPSDMLRGLNQLLYPELSRAEMFITVQLALVNPRERKLTVASAGHCPLLCANGPDFQTVCLSSKGVPIGVFPYSDYHDRSMRLEENFRICLHTDGLTELRDDQGRMFGRERLVRWLEGAARRREPAHEFKRELGCVLEDFRGGAPLKDDLTVLLVADESSIQSPASSPNRERANTGSPGLLERILEERNSNRKQLTI